MMMTRRMMMMAMKTCRVDPAWLRFPPWAAWGGDQPLTWLSYFVHKDDHEDDFDSKLANTHICLIHLGEVTWSSWSPSSKCLKPFLRQPTVTRKSSRSFLQRWFCSGEPSLGKPPPTSTTSPPPSLSSWTKWLPSCLPTSCFFLSSGSRGGWGDCWPAKRQTLGDLFVHFVFLSSSSLSTSDQLLRWSFFVHFVFCLFRLYRQVTNF